MLFHFGYAKKYALYLFDFVINTMVLNVLENYFYKNSCRIRHLASYKQLFDNPFLLKAGEFNALGASSWIALK